MPDSDISSTTLPGRQQRFLLALASLGVADAIYLLAAHASGNSLACPRFGWIDCDAVVSSRYAIALGLPLALWGLLGYLSVITLALWAHAAARSQPGTDTSHRVSSMPMLLARALTTAMATVSCYLVYLMIAVIHGLCLYCLGSFLLSLGLFAVANCWPWPRRVAAFSGSAAISGLLAGVVALTVFGVSSHQPDPGNPADFLPLATPVWPIPYSSGPAEMGLARWLSDHGARMYGGYRCPHCFRQKCLFGRPAFDLIPYVECDPSTPSARPDLCRPAGIREYPTWEISGKYFPGEENLEQLAELAGYPGDRQFVRHIAR